MKTFYLVVLFAASAAASGSASFRMEPSPVYTSLRNNIPIVRFAQDISPGSDAVSFETGNGIVMDHNTQVVPGRRGRYEDAHGKFVETDSSVVKSGSYAYVSPEGIPINVKWVADENGFRVEGDHIPTVAPLEPLPVRAMQGAPRNY